MWVGNGCVGKVGGSGWVAWSLGLPASRQLASQKAVVDAKCRPRMPSNMQEEAEKAEEKMYKAHTPYFHSGIRQKWRKNDLCERRTKGREKQPTITREK